jgi:hypothetical protein
MMLPMMIRFKGPFWRVRGYPGVLGSAAFTWDRLNQLSKPKAGVAEQLFSP